MKAYDIFLSIIIIVLIISIIFMNTLSIGVTHIKKNWPEYRCNPTIMPFASYFGHEPISNFTYCIQNMQSSYMNILMQPAHYIINLMHNIISGLMNDIDMIRKKFYSLITNIENIVYSIFGVFINIIIQFQYMIIKIKDVFSKMIGIMVANIYLIEGTMKTGQSIINGPIGDTLNFVCFHPDTEIILENGEKVKMIDAEIGSKLKNGSEILATMKIKGKDETYDKENKMYEIYSEILDEYIYVTGSHLMYDEDRDIFIKVMHHPKSQLREDITSEILTCLITKDHKIQIGEHIFWDWED